MRVKTGLGCLQGKSGAQNWAFWRGDLKIHSGVIWILGLCDTILLCCKCLQSDFIFILHTGSETHGHKAVSAYVWCSYGHIILGFILWSIVALWLTRTASKHQTVRVWYYGQISALLPLQSAFEVSCSLCNTSEL